MDFMDRIDRNGNSNNTSFEKTKHSDVSRVSKMIQAFVYVDRYCKVQRYQHMHGHSLLLLAPTRIRLPVGSKYQCMCCSNEWFRH